MINKNGKTHRRWTFFIALRYFNSRRKDKNFASSVLSVIGIAAGTLTLITVIAVMNGFQIGFIEDILEISSFHIRVQMIDDENNEPFITDLTQIKGVKSVLPVVETQTLIKTDFSGFEPCLIRGIPPDARIYDSSMIEQLNIIEADSRTINDNDIFIGIELANHLGVVIGDEINILSLAGDTFKTIKPEQVVFRIAGLFKSGYYEYDRGLGFVNLDTIKKINSSNERLVLGVKLDNRYKDRIVMYRIESDLPSEDFESVISWREYNSSFFGALRMEKIAMMVLIGLIFLVVGGNIYQSLKRTVIEKTEEISVLKSIGGDGKSIRRIFIFDGIFIGFIGSICGLTAGLVIAFNINTVFAIFETVSNAFLSIIRQIVNPLLGAGLDEISVFSPRYYYMSEVPVVLPFWEVLFIFLFGFLSATVAAYFASKRITQIKPSEVLRYE